MPTENVIFLSFMTLSQFFRGPHNFSFLSYIPIHRGGGQKSHFNRRPTFLRSYVDADSEYKVRFFMSSIFGWFFMFFYNKFRNDRKTKKNQPNFEIMEK